MTYNQAIKLLSSKGVKESNYKHFSIEIQQIYLLTSQYYFGVAAKKELHALKKPIK